MVIWSAIFEDMRMDHGTILYLGTLAVIKSFQMYNISKIDMGMCLEIYESEGNLGWLRYIYTGFAASLHLEVNVDTY